MNRVTYLLDEHVPTYVRDAALTLAPAIDIVQIGVDPGVPPKGTLDPSVIAFAEEAGFAVVSFDKRTFRADADQHVARGRHHWGVFLFPNGRNFSAGVIAEQLRLIWESSDAEEWIDRVVFLPL